MGTSWSRDPLGFQHAQHSRYFRKKGIFTNPQKAFAKQLITQLRAWQAAGEGIILFADMNEKVYMEKLACAL
jgi:hypothetical protein